MTPRTWRRQWPTKSSNFQMLYGLLMSIFPEWEANKPPGIWKIFEEVEDYMIKLEENDETEKGDEKRVL